MSYSYVGSADTIDLSGTAYSIDVSTISPGSLTDRDVAYIVLAGGLGTASQLPLPVPPAGWTQVGSATRNPGPGGGTYNAVVFEHPCDGTETTVTFTEGNGSATGEYFIAALVYRDLSPIGSDASQQDPSTSSTDSSPWTENNPTPVTATLPSTAHAFGATPQALFYLYFDGHTPMPILRDSTDSNLIERLTMRDGSVGLFLAWFDEPWASASNLPSRAVSTHSTGGTSFHRGALARMHGAVEISAPSGGDAWAWVG